MTLILGGIIKMAASDYIVVGDTSPHRLVKEEFELLAKDWRLEDRKDITKKPFCEHCLLCHCKEHLQRDSREYYCQEMVDLGNKPFTGKTWIRGRERSIAQGKIFTWICRLCIHKKKLQMDFHELGEPEPSIDKHPKEKNIDKHPKEEDKK